MLPARPLQSFGSRRRSVSCPTPAAQSCYSRTPDAPFPGRLGPSRQLQRGRRPHPVRTNSPSPQSKHHSNPIGCRIRRKRQGLTSNGPIESARRLRHDLARRFSRRALPIEFYRFTGVIRKIRRGAVHSTECHCDCHSTLTTRNSRNIVRHIGALRRIRGVHAVAVRKGDCPCGITGLVVVRSAVEGL